ncbi:hypothetical protein [Modicisalibacter coralii]|uniref:hypothetical protein n=1 Tax=Modicisalibacter coralii TaxID=2304602 RepID=UPI00100B95B9|nr:hypothetical protein [Halomonas coralii]
MDETQPARQVSRDQPGDPRRPTLVGLLPAPEQPADIAESLAGQLPELLADYVDDRLAWDVQVVVDPLTGAMEDSDSIIDKTEAYKHQREWDYVICITDLPIYKERRYMVAEASMARCSAIVSLPAFGATGIRQRLRESILQLVNEMHHGSSEAARERQERRTEASDKVSDDLRGEGARRLMGHRLFESLIPIHRETPEHAEGNIDVRFVTRSRLGGSLRILSGMVRANRPWTVFPAFRSVIAVAFATGAYGLIFPTFWKLNDSYGGSRLVVLMLTAMIAMVIWIMLAHGLWEPLRKASSRHIARLYNMVTVLTLSTAVVFYYGVLYLLFLFAVYLFVPASLLSQNLGHAVGPANYLSLAWLASSLATLAGALGAGLEDDTTVLNATYGYRQRRRNKQMRQDDGD